MFCPQCHVEYRPGFTRCTDCDVDLVYELPAETHHKKNPSDEDPQIIQDGEDVRIVWEGDSESDCVDVCRELLEGGIVYRVNQSAAGRDLKMHVDFKYQIAVRSMEYENARKALGYSEDKEGTMWTEEEVESGIAELAAQDDVPVEEVHGDWNPKGWFPEDAAQEVWTSDPHGGETIVETSLKENRISYRIEQRGAEPRRVFVMPEDEARAREIVREIVEGEPPK